MAYACAAEAPEGSAVVVGLVRDPISGIVLPDAKVTATWRDGSSLLWSEAVSDPAGRYRICGMKPSSGIIRERGRGPGPAQGGGRRSVPGLRVREIQLEGQPPIVCVETSRRQQSILLDQPCDAVQVVLDGVRIANGVVVVFTRGRGPYTSPLRNRR
jgi:hypothetical protein